MPAPNKPKDPDETGNCPAGYNKVGKLCVQKPTPPDDDGKCPAGSVKIEKQCVFTHPIDGVDGGGGEGDGDGEESAFGGACAAGFTCKGDAIQCAIAHEQHRMNCKLYGPDTDANSVVNKAIAGTDDYSMDKLKSEAQQVAVGTFDQAGLGWSHSCPADPSIPLNFGGRSAEFKIPFSRICGPLGILSLAGVGLTLLGSMVWVLGGRNNRG